MFAAGTSDDTGRRNDPPDRRTSFRDIVLEDSSPLAAPVPVDTPFSELGVISYLDDEKRIPRITCKKEVLEKLCLPWKDAILVKLLGKHISLPVLKVKLERMWKLKGRFEIVDMDKGFAMVKVDRREDREHILTGGP